MKIRLPFITALAMLFNYYGFSQTGMWTWLKGADTINQLYGNLGTQGVEAASNNPPSFYEPCQWTDTAGNFWLYGGNNQGGFTYNIWGDLWKFNPVSNNWTWVKGTGEPDFLGAYGTQGVPSANNLPPALTDGMCTWTDHQGNLWLYGGIAVDSNLRAVNAGALWRYNIASNMWTWMKGPDTLGGHPVYGIEGVEDPLNVPGSRCECAAGWVDSLGNLWFYGGSTVGMYGDLWRYNIATNNWTWMGGSNTINTAAVYGIKGIAAAGNTPGSRWVYTSWTDANWDFWLFGGLRINGRLNDVWRYQPLSGKWTWIAGATAVADSGKYGSLCTSDTGLAPANRFENRACWKDDCGNCWFYGGEGTSPDSDNILHNDLWCFNPASLKWTLVNGGSAYNGPVYGVMGVASAANTPGGRMGSVSWRSKSGRLYLFGGSLAGFDNSYNDVWMFTVDTSCGSVPTETLIAQTASLAPGCGQNNGAAWADVSSGRLPYTFHWSTGSNADTLSNVAAGTYQLTATDNSGCSISASVTVNSGSAGNVMITASDTSFCPGDSASICAPAGYTSYAWNNGLSANCIEAKQAGDYYVNVTEANGCSAISNHLSIRLFTPPSVSISAHGDTLQVFNAVSYQWYLNSMLLPGATDSIYIAHQSGTYTVAVTDTNGCTSTSSGQVIKLTGISNVQSALNINAYPNPTTGQIYFTGLPDRCSIEIYDVLGQLVYSPPAAGNNYMLDISSKAKGIYFYRITDNANVLKAGKVALD